MAIVRKKLMLVTVGLKGLRLVSGTAGVRGRGCGGTFDYVEIKHWNCKHSSRVISSRNSAF